MIAAVKELLDVVFHQPVVPPAPLAGACHGLEGRFAWSISIGVRGSTQGSSYSLATIWAMLSPTVGIPHILVPPFFFGMPTALTGGGKYLPDDIRFQIFYRWSLRFPSTSVIDSASTPAAPHLALTC